LPLSLIGPLLAEILKKATVDEKEGMMLVLTARRLAIELCAPVVGAGKKHTRSLRSLLGCSPKVGLLRSQNHTRSLRSLLSCCYPGLAPFGRSGSLRSLLACLPASLAFWAAAKVSTLAPGLPSRLSGLLGCSPKVGGFAG
jgi:hypothetical protein